MEGVTEMQSVMYDLIMKVTNEIKSEMEVSTINEPSMQVKQCLQQMQQANVTVLGVAILVVSSSK